MLLFTTSSLCLSLLLIPSTTTTCRGLLLSRTTGLLVPVLLSGVVITPTLLTLRSELRGLQNPRDTDLVDYTPLLFLNDLGPDYGWLESCEVDSGKDGAA